MLEKIIRKKQENAKKYKSINKNNYEKFITDLIGIRCLILFKEDWINFHQYLLSNFENNTDYYIKDSLADFDEDESHNYIAEKPKVHIRNGDSHEIYEKYLSPDSILDGKIYRSVHYIIKYCGIYLEIQVRTLFEEGWGEIDHEIVYPYHQNDPVFKEYTELLNRLSGLADEMSGFFQRLKELKNNNDECSGSLNNVDNDSPSSQYHKKNNTLENSTPKNNIALSNTAKGCLKDVLDE